MQDGHPLAYLSKPLGPKSRVLSAYEKEYMAILIAVQTWRAYLQCQEFIILTDQRSLQQLSEQRLHTQWQQKVFTKLLGLQCRIVYKGVNNHAADALSRCPAPEASCAAITTSVPNWLTMVTSSFAQDLLSKLALDPAAVPNYTLQSGILRYRNRIWIGANTDIQKELIGTFHDSAWGSHSGIPVTHMKIKQCFAWRGMKSSIHDYTRACSVCQQSKPDRAKSPGLLQPLPVSASAWQVISLDFIEGLPLSGSFNCVLVVADLLTKYAHFVPLCHPFTAAGVAKAFFTNVYRLHGLPTTIISDRDRILTSRFWTELFCLVDVQLARSTAYHPQSDGQTERINQCLETDLRCFVHACPSQWHAWLSNSEFWYNSSLHSAIGRSPFEALYGYAPRLLDIPEASGTAQELGCRIVAGWILSSSTTSTEPRQG